MSTRRRLVILTPASPGPEGGNHVTAERWAAHLRALGHRVQVTDRWPAGGARYEDDDVDERHGGKEQPCDDTSGGVHALVALHADKTSEGVRAAVARAPALRVVVACAGTDLYRDGGPTPETLAALGRAHRIVVLQPDALERLPPELAERARVVYQSVEPLARRPGPLDEVFEACVVANLRAVKDPLLPARAARRLPAASRVLVRLVGGVLEPELGDAARVEARENPRFVWDGPLSRRETLTRIARARLVVSPSLHEGGSNTVSEALAHGAAILATSIPGTLGLLGPDAPGTFAPRDEAGLTRLLDRAERDPAWLESLRAASRARRWITEPAREREAWRTLLEELFCEGMEAGAGA